MKAFSDKVSTANVSTDLQQQLTELPGTGVSFLIPVQFGATAIPKQFKFAFLPTFNFSGWEKAETDPTQGPIGQALFFSVLPDSAALPGGRPLADTILSEVLAQFPDAKWEGIDTRSEQNVVVSWKRILVQGAADFSDGQGAMKRAEGVLQIFLREGQGQRVIVGWLAPASLEAQIRSKDIAPVMAGTLKIAGQQVQEGALPAAS